MREGKTLFVDFEASYCFVFCLDDEKPLPIRSGYEQKKYAIQFILDAKNNKYEVITQNMESEMGAGATLVTNLIPLAAIDESNKELEIIQSLFNVDIVFENGGAVLQHKYKDNVYSIPAKTLITAFIQKLIDNAKAFLKEDIAAIIFSTSLDINRNINKSVISLLNESIRECKIKDSYFIPYHDVMFSYFGVQQVSNRRVFLIHFDSIHFSFVLKEFQGVNVLPLTSYSNMLGGYRCLKQYIADAIINEYKSNTGSDMISEKVRSNPNLLQKKMKNIFDEIDRMEVDLRNGDEFDFGLGRGKTAISLTIHKTSYVKWKREWMNNMIQEIQDHLKTKKLAIESIMQVLVEGECANDPLFQEALVSIFPGDRCVFDNLPEEVIGMGLCLMDVQLTKRFVDKNYGLLISKDQFVWFLNKGSSIPCQCRKDFTTIQDNQKEFMVYLVCKDSIDSDQFTIMDEYYISDLGAEKDLDFEFVFQIEDNGILSVSCYEQLKEREILSTQSYPLFIVYSTNTINSLNLMKDLTKPIRLTKLTALQSRYPKYIMHHPTLDLAKWIGNLPAF